MTGKKLDGDFTACDTALLNRFFRDYNAAHTRGGTNTKQRNLRHLFTWLEAEEERRVAVVAPATARAIAAYLRARRYHRLADSPFVWLGLRNSGPLDGMGLYRMLRRRAEQADYEPAVHPHMSGDSA